MKGFLRRDLTFLLLNLRFYAAFILILSVLAVFRNRISGFLSLYIVIFSMSAVISLSNFDEANGWLSYAAAVPHGRRDMVEARYRTAILVSLVTMAVMALLGLLDGGFSLDTLGTVGLFGGVCLAYSAICIPLTYRFGGNRSRLILVALVAVVAALLGMGAVVVGLVSNFGAFLPPSTSLLILAAGALLLALSRPLSLRIMAKKEL